MKEFFIRRMANYKREETGYMKEYELLNDEVFKTLSVDCNRFFVENLEICREVFGYEIADEIAMTARKLAEEHPEYDYEA